MTEESEPPGLRGPSEIESPSAPKEVLLEQDRSSQSNRYIIKTAQSLFSEAQAHGVTINELQINFDCGQKKLAGYRLWLQSLRTAIHPQRLVITALPSWLKESDFLSLAREADGYVLQVHSFQLSESVIMPFYVILSACRRNTFFRINKR